MISHFSFFREVAAAEKVARDSDERMLTGLRGGSINQYLVLVEPALGTLDSDSKSENMQLTAQSTKSIPLSSFGSAYSDSKGSIIPPSSAQFTSSKSSSKYDQKIEDLFWVNVDGAGNGAGKTKNVYTSAADRRKDFYESFRKYVEARIEKGTEDILCIILLALLLLNIIGNALLIICHTTQMHIIRCSLSSMISF